MQKAFVNLWNIAGTGIIIPYESNVVFTTVAGGITCVDPGHIEGVFIPLPHGGLLFESIYKYFSNKWNGYCYIGDIKEEDADNLDAIFQKHIWGKHLKVDRTKLHLCGEAWIHVTLHYPDEKHPLFSGFESKTAVLT